MGIYTKLNPIRLLGSLYNANKIEESIGKIKVGDSIDYEINGYSNWQVVSIDKENNTLDVVSKENVEDITLETKDDYINALDTFQETANKYTDDKLAIKYSMAPNYRENAKKVIEEMYKQVGKPVFKNIFAKTFS